MIPMVMVIKQPLEVMNKAVIKVVKGSKLTVVIKEWLGSQTSKLTVMIKVWLRSQGVITEWLRSQQTKLMVVMKEWL